MAQKKDKKKLRPSGNPLLQAVQLADKSVKSASKQQEKKNTQTKAATRFLARQAQGRSIAPPAANKERLTPLQLAKIDAQSGTKTKDKVAFAKQSGLVKDTSKTQESKQKAAQAQAQRQKERASVQLSKADRKLPQGSKQIVQDAKLAFAQAQKAGDKEAMAKAHEKAEAQRAWSGYSGGASGAEYLAPELTIAERRALNSAGEKALKKAKLDYEKAKASGDKKAMAKAQALGTEVRNDRGYREGGSPGLEYTGAHDQPTGYISGEERKRMAAQDLAALQSAATGAVGSLLSLAETGSQALRNKNRERYRNRDEALANNLTKLETQLALVERGEGSPAWGTAESLRNKIALAREAAERLEKPTIVDPNLPGQRLMERSQEYAAQALKGRSGLDRLLTQAGISVAQNLPGIGLSFIPGVGPAVGAGVMGAQAAGAKAYDLNTKGIAPGEAFTRGLISGGIEGATERIPIGSLLRIVRGSGGQSVLRNIAKQAGIEAGEEGTSYVANYLADRAAQDPDAEFSLQDLAESAAVGAISGAGFGGVGTGINAAAAARAQARQNNPLLRAIDRFSAPQQAQEAQSSEAGETTPMQQETPLMPPGKYAANEKSGSVPQPWADVSRRHGIEETLPESEASSLDSIVAETTQEVNAETPYSVGAAPGGFDPYSRMLNEYGAIEPGENPARMVDVPQSTDGEDRVSRWTRTAMEAEITSPETREQIAQGIVENGFSYRPRKDKASLDKAFKTIEEKGVEGALTQWQDVVEGRRTASKDDMVLAQTLYVNAERSGDSNLAAQLAAQIAAEGTIAGQNVQALRLLKKATPEGRVYYMRKIVGKLNEDLAKKKRVDSLTEDQKVTLDDGLVQRYMQAETDAAQTDALNAIYDDVARQIKPTAGDVVNAWRYFAMLGNPRTHIRNVLGNVLFGGVRTASNELSALLQGIALRDRGQRTRAFASTQEARSFAKEDYKAMKSTLSGDKYAGDMDAIRRRVQDRALGPFSFLSKANSWALNAEDLVAKRSAYIRSLSQYITARNWDPNALTPQQLDAARTHAIHDADVATFQEASKVAEAIGRFERTNTLTKLAVGGAFPFKGVPINIAKQGFNYSPAGLLKSISLDAAKVRRGEMTAAEMIDDLSAGLTGTGIAALGYFLASQGWISAGGSDDDKEGLLETAQGSQEYSLNIGDWSYTIDWAAPAVLPLFIGAEFRGMLEEEAGEDIDQKFSKGLDALERMFEPMINMTVLSGVSSTLQSAAYNQGDPLTAVAGNLAQNYAGQFIPTLSGQIARTIDPVRRSTYVDKNSGIPASWQRFIQTQQNKIPGQSQKNVPYLNVWGEETVNDNPLIRAIQNFASPGYLSKRESGDTVGDELKRLNQLGYDGVLPSIRQKGQKVDLNGDGTAEHLTREQWETWQKSQGQTAKTLLSDLIASSDYQTLSDEEKAKAVKRILDFSKDNGKLEVGGSKDSVDSWVLNAREYAEKFGNGSPQGFFDAYNEKSAIDKSGYDNGIKQGLLEDYINASDETPEAKNFLLEGIKFWNMNPANSTKYTKGLSLGLDADKQQAYNNIKKNDATYDADGNGSYTQSELVNLIKSTTNDPEEQNLLWKYWGNSNWKKTFSQAASGSSTKKKGSTKKSSTSNRGTFYVYD